MLAGVVCAGAVSGERPRRGVLGVLVVRFELPPWPLVDFHAHFPVVEDDFMAPYRLRYVKKHGLAKWQTIAAQSTEMQGEWQRAWAFPRPEPAGSDWEAQADRWYSETQEYGLRAVVFTSCGGNDRLNRVVRRHPDRFVGFAHHDILSAGAAAELARAVDEYGFRGLKIFGPLVTVPLSDPCFEPVWEVAEMRRIPVLIHFGILGGAGGVGNGVNIDPLCLHDVAKAFPGIPFVVPHFGCGYVRELLQLCWACPNVYVDTSGNNEWVRWMPYPLDLPALFRKFYETIGPRRIIFGSDSSWFPRGFAVRYLLDQLRACSQIGMSAADQQEIFGGNAARLLNLTL